MTRNPRKENSPEVDLENLEINFVKILLKKVKKLYKKQKKQMCCPWEEMYKRILSQHK